MQTAIKADRLIDGQNSKPLEKPVILVENGNIISVGKEGSITIPPGTEIVNLEGQTVLPGMADCHVHLSVDGGTSYDPVTFRELTPFVTVRAAACAKKDLLAGFTTLRTMGEKAYIDVGLKQGIEANLTEGPRLAASGYQLAITGGRDNLAPEIIPPDSIFKVCDGPEGMRVTVREHLKYNVDWIKLGVTGAVLAGDGPPGMQQFTEEEIKVAVQCANMYGKKVSAHAHGAEGVKASVRAGVDSIEHACLADKESLEMMAANGVYWVPTFSPLYFILKHGVAGGIPSQIVERTKAVTDMHQEAFAKGLQMGIKIVMGTDTGMPYNYHGSNAVELQLMVEAGMDKMEAIKSTTSRAAEMLGWEKETGTIAPGFKADIISVKGNPLEDIKLLQNVAFVMKGGVVYKT